MDRMKGVSPGEVLRHRRRRRPEVQLEGSGCAWPATRSLHRSPPWTDNDWAVQLAEVLQASCTVGERLYIVPEWDAGMSPSQRAAAPLYLNPGLTFGTGSHASTQLCLEGVEEHTLTGRPRAGPGLRQRHPLHRRSVLGCQHRRRRWTSTPKRWMWPMRMPPSTASAGTAIPSGREMSSPTGRWPPSWPGSSYASGAGQHRGRRDHPPVRPGPRLCWRRTGCSCAPASSTPGLDEVEEALVRQGLTLTGRREKNGWVALEARCPSPRG